MLKGTVHLVVTSSSAFSLGHFPSQLPLTSNWGRGGPPLKTVALGKVWESSPTARRDAIYPRVPSFPRSAPPVCNGPVTSLTFNSPPSQFFSPAEGLPSFCLTPGAPALLLGWLARSPAFTLWPGHLEQHPVWPSIISWRGMGELDKAAPNGTWRGGGVEG